MSKTITSTIAVVMVCIMTTGVTAQTTATAGSTQNLPDQTLNTAMLRDHIAVDVSISLPMRDVSERLDLDPGYGFNLHFWKGISDRTFMIVSVGNSWFQMGTSVQTDTAGIVDLSDYSLTISPLLGGIGQVVPFGDGFNGWASLHAGVTIFDVVQGTRVPVTFIEDNSYFSMAGAAGLSYAITQVTSIIFSTRYVHLFGEDYSRLDFGLGASFHW
jgi:opacity protein-like surface antigen